MRIDRQARFESARRAVMHWLADGWFLPGLGALSLAACLLSPDPSGDWSLWDGPRQVGALLRGTGFLGDVTQDIVGFRRLLDGRDPYPILGPALKEIGIDWPVTHASTHPPTAYLLAAPIAFLPWGLAGQVWVVLGFAMLFIAACLHGVPWRPALGLALLSPFWRPTAASFQNLTLVWLLGVAVAFRCRNGKGTGAGLGIALASMPKLVPAGLTAYFMLRRKPGVLLSFVAVWAVAIALLHRIAPGAWSAYLGPGSRATTWATILRPDNSGLLPAAYTLGGAVGLVLACAWIAGLLLRNAATLLCPDRDPEHAFFLYSFLSVALLPIAWGYSVVPLLPVLGYFVVRGRVTHVVLASAALAGYGLLNPFDRWVVLGTVVTSVLFWMRSPTAVPSVSPAPPARCPGS